MKKCKEINKKDRQWSDNDISYFLPKILKINESWNLIDPKAHLPTLR